MLKPFQKIIDFLLYSNIFIGLCTVALTLTNQLTIEGTIKFDNSCWFVLFATVFTYSYLKFRHPELVEATTGHRYWARQNSQLSGNILVLSLIATGAFFLTLRFKTMLVVMGLAAFTALYGFVEIPLPNGARKLRDFGLLKTLFVALVWSVTTVIVPLENSSIDTPMMIFLLLRRFLFVGALTMVFEIKDMSGDKEYGLKTLPILFGVTNTKLIAQGCLFLLMLINLTQYLFFEISIWNMGAVNLSLLVSIICIQPLKEETPETWYYLVLDGMMILQFAFVYLATKVFE